MTIKNLGGVFGRNPTFNDVTIEGQLTFDGDIDINSDLSVDGALDVTGFVTSEGLVHNGDSNTYVKFLPDRIYMDVGGNRGIDLEVNSTKIVNNGTVKLQTSSTDGLVVDANQDVQIPNGNIEMSSGHGIDFSASGTAGSELFDDYEEGESGALTMTPQTSGTITLNTNYDTFKYTKIGDRVTISGQFVVSSVSSPVGAKVTLPLPFTSASGVSKRAGTAAYYYTGGGVETLIPCGVSEGSTNLTIHLDASTIVAGHEFWFDVTYQAA